MFGKIGSLCAFVLLLGSVGCGAADETGDGTVEISSRSARFETFVGIDGKTYFDLVAGNGQNVLRSQGYSSAADAQTGIDSVTANGADAQSFQILEASDGSYYFDLTAKNHEIIGTSQMYTTKSDATRGASTVRALVLLLGNNGQVVNAPKAARFEVFTGEDKKFYFHLRAGNGEIILVSQAYTAKASAISGIKSVIANGVNDSQWDVFSAINGEYGIRLVATNGQTIGSGELYSTQSNANRGIDAIEAALTTKLTVVSE